MIRHVIFDLDGTLVDSSAVCVAILSEMLVARGSDAMIDPVAARSYMSLGGTSMISGLLGTACIDPATDLAEFRQRYLTCKTSRDTLFPHVAASLQRLLDAGFVLSICSNKPQNLCEKVLMDVGLADHFALIVGGQPRLRPKPAPDLLDAVLHGLGAGAHECLFVGDSELDHEVAQRAAVPFHFVSYGYAAENWVPHDCAIHHCFQGLTDAIVSHRVHA